MPHLVEESYSYLLQKSDSTFFTSHRPLPKAQWANAELEKVMEVVLSIKKAINQKSGEESTLKLDTQVELAAPEYNTLQVGFLQFLEWFIAKCILSWYNITSFR